MIPRKHDRQACLWSRRTTYLPLDHRTRQRKKESRNARHTADPAQAEPEALQHRHLGRPEAASADAAAAQGPASTDAPAAIIGVEPC